MDADETADPTRYDVAPIGWIESPLIHRADVRQLGDAVAPNVWLAIDDRFRDGLLGLDVGSEIIVLTWLDRAARDVLLVRPRGDPANRLQGVFNTRSPDRPNPIGLHRVRILAVRGTRLLVSGLDAIDRTPILDLKPVLDPLHDG